MGIMVNITGIAININGTMSITTGTLKPWFIITDTVKVVDIVMFHMRSLMLLQVWSLVHITGLQVLRP